MRLENITVTATGISPLFNNSSMTISDTTLQGGEFDAPSVYSIQGYGTFRLEGHVAVSDWIVIREYTFSLTLAAGGTYSLNGTTVAAETDTVYSSSNGVWLMSDVK